MAKMTLNEQFNGVEIFFEEKPDTKVLEQLKANGFRWHNFKKIWYAKRTEKTLTLATSICGKSKADEVAENVAKVVANLHKETPKPKTETKKAEPKKAETKKQTKAEPQKAEKKTEPKKANVVEFKAPKPKEPIKRAFVGGSSTYEDCEKKLASAMKKYTDNDSQYCLTGLLEYAKVSPDFCNHLMQSSKTYEKALNYCAEMCQKGFGFLRGNVGMMSSDMALGFMIDYFLMADEQAKAE